jgi:hypothetical protein
MCRASWQCWRCHVRAASMPRRRVRQPTSRHHRTRMPVAAQIAPCPVRSMDVRPCRHQENMAGTTLLRSYQMMHRTTARSVSSRNESAGRTSVLVAIHISFCPPPRRLIAVVKQDIRQKVRCRFPSRFVLQQAVRRPDSSLVFRWSV